MIFKVNPNNYKLSVWSGGKTTQLAIYPAESEYKNRDFTWRVSSAIISEGESDFTSLPDYDRLICPLEGSICLTHNGGDEVRLEPLEVHRFDGADATHCLGNCTDFNLMMKKGAALGEIIPASTDKKEMVFGIELSKGETIVVYSAEGRTQMIDSGEPVILRAGETGLYEAGWDCSIRLRLYPHSVAVAAVIKVTEDADD